VTRILDSAIEKSGLDMNIIPKLLSDNDSCDTSSELAEYFKDKAMSPVREMPMHLKFKAKQNVGIDQ
jgi:hypothetical protein